MAWTEIHLCSLPAVILYTFTETLCRILSPVCHNHITSSLERSKHASKKSCLYGKYIRISGTQLDGISKAQCLCSLPSIWQTTCLLPVVNVLFGVSSSLCSRSRSTKRIYFDFRENNNKFQRIPKIVYACNFTETRN